MRYGKNVGSQKSSFIKYSKFLWKKEFTFNKTIWQNPTLFSFTSL